MPKRTKRVCYTGSNDSEDPVPKKSTRGHRKAPVKQMKQGVNYAQQGLIWSTNMCGTSKQRKGGVNDLKNQLQKQGDELVNFIEMQLKTPTGSGSGSGSGSSSGSFSKTRANEQLDPDLTPVLPWMEATSTSSSISSTHPAQLMEKTLEELYSIIDTYEKINTQDNSIRKPNWMRWEEDGSDLVELNEHAMGFAAQSAEYSVMPKHQDPLSKLSTESNDIERMAWEMMEQGIPNKYEETWGMSAQGHAKAFTEILGRLPSERRR